MAVNALANPAAAASAYASTAKTAVGQGGDAASFTDAMKEASNTPNFMDTVKGALADSIGTLQAGEKASAQAVTGKANLADVVQAATSAELTMETVVALRDKMLGAYQEIMRMPI